MKPEIRALTRVLWDYNRFGHEPRDADVLIAMGTNDAGVAEHAAALDSRFSYRHVVVTGGVFHEKSLHGQDFGETEARHFARLLAAKGVDPARIIIENAATNTGENITLSRALLQAKGGEYRTGHLVHTPSMLRRAFATAQKQWPEMDWTVSAQDVPFDSYLDGLDVENFIHGIVGDTVRVLDYPAKGFQTSQPMPPDVRDALSALIDAGFTRRVPDGFMKGAS